MWMLLVIFIHSQYPVLCCNGDKDAGDCKSINCDSVTETKDGYDWNGFHFKPKQVYPSFDRDCHVCVYRQVSPLCVFIQPSS